MHRFCLIGAGLAMPLIGTGQIELD